MLYLYTKNSQQKQDLKNVSADVFPPFSGGGRAAPARANHTRCIERRVFIFDKTLQFTTEEIPSFLSKGVGGKGVNC